MVKSSASSKSRRNNEEDSHPRRQRLHRPSPLQARARDHRLGGLWHGHAGRPHRGPDGERRFKFFEGDITINKEWIEYHVRKCDTVLPLVAIATPATYVKEPLRVFELDFEANLPIVRACVRHQKRLVFPSTSEVYGMSSDRL